MYKIKWQWIDGATKGICTEECQRPTEVWACIKGVFCMEETDVDSVTVETPSGKIFGISEERVRLML